MPKTATRRRLLFLNGQLLAGVLCTLAAPQLTAAQLSQADQRVTAGLSTDRVRELMAQFNRALGVECTHCHVDDHWQDESKPAFATARNMYRMVREINERLLLDVGTVACWTCHRGQVQPSRLPRERLDEQLARWPPELSEIAEPKKLAMSVYSVTLGVECDHCHVQGDWKDAEKPTIKLVSRMTAMFETFPKFMPPKARTQCWMCHKGSKKPEASPKN